MNRLSKFFILVLLSILMTSCNGDTVEIISDTIHHEQLVIASLGDSYASGEGNPDTLSTATAAPIWLGYYPQWLGDPDGQTSQEQEKRNAEICHRSRNNRHMFAVQEIAPLWRPDEEQDGDTSVIMRSFACSGTTIKKGLLEPQFDAGLVWENGDGMGAIPCAGNDAPCNDSQLEQLRTWLVASNLKLDILLLSIGGNDIGFASAITACSTLLTACINNQDLNTMVDNGCFGQTETNQSNMYCVNAGDAHTDDGANPHIVGLNGLSDRLDKFYDELTGDGFNGLLSDQFRVVLTGYTSGMKDYSGQYCNGWNDGYTVGLSYTQAPIYIYLGASMSQMTTEKSAWGESVINELNTKLGDFADDHDEWVFVDMTGVDQEHGVCSNNRWTNTFRDSLEKQGSIWGSAHPNIEGHKAMSEQIVPELIQILNEVQYPDPNSDPFIWNRNSVRVNGDVDIFNDNLIWDNDDTFSFDDTFTLAPVSSIYEPKTSHKVQYWFCLDEEVRVDVSITVNMQPDRSITATVSGFLYESTACFPPQDDLDVPTESQVVTVPVNSDIPSSSDLDLHIESLLNQTHADINLTIENNMSP
ncbi:MAG: hypothetical protein GY796_32255 [Chloroflexi bacterium]|nr:hypothetical protein [Chloroflexota bacterium]